MTRQFMVKVVPGAKQIRVAEILGGLKVWLTALPKEGEANKQLIDVLAEHFKVAKHQIEIKRGWAGRTKVVEIKS